MRTTLGTCPLPDWDVHLPWDLSCSQPCSSGSRVGCRPLKDLIITASHWVFPTFLTSTEPPDTTFSSWIMMLASQELSVSEFVILAVSTPSGLGQVTEALVFNIPPGAQVPWFNCCCQRELPKLVAPIIVSLRQTPGITGLWRVSQFIQGLGPIQDFFNSFLGEFQDAETCCDLTGTDVQLQLTSSPPEGGLFMQYFPPTQHWLCPSTEGPQE